MHSATLDIWIMLVFGITTLALVMLAWPLLVPAGRMALGAIRGGRDPASRRT